MNAAHAPAAARRLDITPAVGLALLGMPAIALVPRVLHVSSVAGAGGYDPAVAHLLLTLLALAVLAIAAVYGWRIALPVAGARPAPPADEGTAPAGGNRGERLSVSLILLVSLLVFVLFLVMYFPPFLARYGPYGEDKYFLSVLQRMEVGQQPYTGFEFIYGPLLIYPMARWMTAFGYSLESYYSLLALVEGATFAGVTAALGLIMPDRRRWFAALAVVLILLVNDNLGISWIALRRLLPVVILLVYAWRGRTRQGAAAVAALIGVQCMISLEYAAACIVAILGAAAVESIGERGVRPLRAAAGAVAGGVVIGGVMAFAMLGTETTEWLRATWRVIALRGAGEAAFPFGLSVNAFAVIALLFLSCARMGAGLPRLLGRAHGGAVRPRLEAGDRFLLASLAYAVIAAKSGMARSDMYHLVPPVLGLVGVALLPLQFAAFAASRALQRASIAAVVLICVTYAPGLIGSSRIWGEGLVRGARDVVTGRPTTDQIPQRSRGPRIGAERTELPPAWIRLAEYLADDARAARPVLFYEAAWGLDRYIGVAKPQGIYATDDYLVSDDAGLELRGFLAEHPDALVVIERSTWQALTGSERAPAYTSMFWFGGRRSPAVRFLEHWSSSHYGSAVIEEQERKRDRWARTVGTYVLEHYAPVGDFDDVLVLGRAS